MRLTFVETVLFTKRVQELGLEAGLRGLQAALMANPTQGDLDPGTGGLRKVRIPDAGRGKGKRGGARVHYLFLLIFDRLPSGRASLQQAPGPRSPYRILLDAVQAVLDSGAVVAREGYGLEEIAYGIWALVHGMATLQQTHLRQHEANFTAVDRHVLGAFVQGLAAP